MGKRFKLCILHIGTEKTGSSSIQSFLTQNRQALSKEGKLYMDTGSVGSQWEFVALAHVNPWAMDTGQILNITDEATREAFKTSFLESFKQQAAQAEKASVLIISSEHFHSRLHSVAMIEALKQLLDPFVENYKILAYFRRQDELAISHYTTRIKSGYQGTNVDLPKASHPAAYYNYSKLISHWAEVFGQKNIQGRLYGDSSQEQNGVINDFCDKCQINPNGKRMPIWYNRSVSATGLKMIQRLHSLYESQDGLSLSTKERHDLIQHISRENPGKFYPLSKVQAETFYTSFTESNTNLHQDLFPDRVEPLFSEDFSQYPEEAETLPDIDDDIILQAIKDWRKPQRQKGLLTLVRKTKKYLKRTIS